MLRSKNTETGQESTQRKFQYWALSSVFVQVLTIVVLKLGANLCLGDVCRAILPFYAMAVILMLLRVVLWNQALARASLSEVYVFTALAPIFLLLSSVLVFHESISPMSALGVSCIAIGIYVQQGRKRVHL